MVDYINRWRNLSIKYDRTLIEDEVVNLIQKNIDGWKDGDTLGCDQGQHVLRFTKSSVQHGKHVLCQHLKLHGCLTAEEDRNKGDFHQT
jgi:hypothetical protein